MKKIAFIRAAAFISSIIFKIIAIPLVIIYRILRMLFSLILRFWRFITSHIRKFKSLLKTRREDRRLTKGTKKKKEKKYHVKKEFWIHAAFKGNQKWYAVIIRKIYWKLFSVNKRLYWIGRGFIQKGYWFIRVLLQKVYWFIRGILQKIYWKFYSLNHRIYWRLRGCFQKLYWSYYSHSRKIYADITKNDYMDLFFVLFRSSIKKQEVKVRFLGIEGVREFVDRHKNTSAYQIIEQGSERTVCIPEFFEKSPERLCHFTSPDIYVAEISNAFLIGGSNVLVVGNTLLNDTAYCDKENRIDIRYSAIKKVLDGVAVIEERPASEQIEKGIYLVGAASFNYYHLIVEILSRLTFIDDYDEYRTYPILVDEIVLTIPQFKAALECINKYKHLVIPVKKEAKYTLGRLIVPSSNVWMPTNVYDRNLIRLDDFMISDTVLTNIRETIGLWEEREPWRKIFISRKNTQAVRLKNEEEIRAIFAEHGFEIVYTEEMSFRQQVECFGQAKCVIAASGAALTNIIFCQPGALIGCIIPSDHRFYMYSTISYLLGLKSCFLDGEIIERTPYAAADTFTLDTGYVERYIDYIKGKY